MSFGLELRRWFDVTKGKAGDTSIEIEGRHMLHPGVPAGARNIEDAFGIRLPSDIHDFYLQWGGGFLLLSEFHYILSPLESIRVTNWFRELRGDKALPIRIVRFCDIGNGDFIGYASFGSAWKVIYLGSEYSDQMTLDEVLGPVVVLGDTFSSWLKETIARDGRFVSEELRSPVGNDCSPASERIF